MQLRSDQLVQAIDGIRGGQLLVVTGAGISRASGIPTFRGSDAGAVWKTTDVSLATLDYFLRDPAGQWRWYLERFQATRRAKPNPAHHAVVQLESLFEAAGGRFLLVTQNIDTLHEAAGSRDPLKVHGSADRIRCSRNGCRLGAPHGSLSFSDDAFEGFRRQPEERHLPTCSECGALLRAHVLFFDEYYLEHADYRFAEAESASEAADLMLFIGTSFSVGITDLYLRAGHQRAIPMFSIDPLAERSRLPGLVPIAAPAEEVLPAVIERLESGGGIGGISTA